jgi:hypothetical protein
MKPILHFLSILTLIVVLCAGCSNYGDSVKKEHIEVYYKKGITKDMAQRTVDFLYSLDTTYNDNSNQVKKSIQVLKKSDTIIFRMVIPMERVASLNNDNFYVLANLLSDSVYNKAPVNIDLTDSLFNSLRVLNYKKMDLE